MGAGSKDGPHNSEQSRDTLVLCVKQGNRCHRLPSQGLGSTALKCFPNRTQCLSGGLSSNVLLNST